MKRNNVKNKGIALLLVITLAAASMSGCGEKKRSRRQRLTLTILPEIPGITQIIRRRKIPGRWSHL